MRTLPNVLRLAGTPPPSLMCGIYRLGGGGDAVPTVRPREVDAQWLRPMAAMGRAAGIIYCDGVRLLGAGRFFAPSADTIKSVPSPAAPFSPVRFIPLGISAPQPPMPIKVLSAAWCVPGFASSI